jgi:hypothetical protein
VSGEVTTKAPHRNDGRKKKGRNKANDAVSENIKKKSCAGSGNLFGTEYRKTP